MSRFDNRLNYIDAAKGIGILLVVLGHHIQGKPELIHWIYSFHMPLFFILTGYLDHRNQARTDLRSYIRKKAAALLWPYYTFSAVNFLWITAFCLIFGVQPEEPFLTILLKMGTTYGYHALWFLPAMFWASVINHSLGKSAPRVTLISAVLLGGCISIYLKHFDGSELLRCVLIYLCRVSVAVSFVRIGKILGHGLDRLGPRQSVVLACICFAVHFCLFPLNSQPNMAVGRLSNIPLYYLLGCAGSVGVILLCKHVPALADNQFLIYASRSSLIIMALHMGFPIELSWLVLGAAGLSAKLSLFWGSAVAVGIEGMILWVSIAVIRRYMPFFLRCPTKHD